MHKNRPKWRSIFPVQKRLLTTCPTRVKGRGLLPPMKLPRRRASKATSCCQREQLETPTQEADFLSVRGWSGAITSVETAAQGGRLPVRVWPGSITSSVETPTQGGPFPTYAGVTRLDHIGGDANPAGCFPTCAGATRLDHISGTTISGRSLSCLCRCDQSQSHRWRRHPRRSLFYLCGCDQALSHWWRHQPRKVAFLLVRMWPGSITRKVETPTQVCGCDQARSHRLRHQPRMSLSYLCGCWPGSITSVETPTQDVAFLPVRMWPGSITSVETPTQGGRFPTCAGVTNTGQARLK
jgi:hypothetical protein